MLFIVQLRVLEITEYVETNKNTHKHEQSSRKRETVNFASGHSACTVSFKLPTASGI